MKNKEQQLNELRMSRRHSYKTPADKKALKWIKKQSKKADAYNNISLVPEFMNHNAPKFGGFVFNGERVSLI